MTDKKFPRTYVEVEHAEDGAPSASAVAGLVRQAMLNHEAATTRHVTLVEPCRVLPSKEAALALVRLLEHSWHDIECSYAGLTEDEKMALAGLEGGPETADARGRGMFEALRSWAGL